MIDRSDVVSAFKAIPDFDEAEVIKNLDAVHYYLRRNGIVTKDALSALVAAPKTLNVIRSLYVDMLHRPQTTPLDPVAVATYGAFLFRFGLKPEVMQVIVQGIMSSPEYREKNPSSSENI